MGEHRITRARNVSRSHLALRCLPLLERKKALQEIVKDQPRILFAHHVERNGCDLFRLVCENDLEGIVTKRRDAATGRIGSQSAIRHTRSTRAVMICLRGV